VAIRHSSGWTYADNSLQEVCGITQLWLEDYNAVRPHQALDGLPPYAHAAAATHF
jgi:transposase InsO family protein